MTAPTDTKIIDLTMASSDDDIIELNNLPNDDLDGTQARSPSPPDMGRIVRSLHARDEARGRKQSRTRVDTAVIVVGQPVEVNDVVRAGHCQVSDLCIRGLSCGPARKL